MSDLGTEIRRYYEEVVQRVDPARPPISDAPQRPYEIRAGIGWALLVALIVLLVFGLGPLLLRPDPESAEPPATTITPTTAPSTSRPAASVGPSVIVTSDGVEIGSISNSEISDSAETGALLGFVVRELTTNGDYWPAGGDPGELLGLETNGPPTGLTVETTIDATVQEIVDSVISEWTTGSEAVVAVVVIDNQTGRIVAAGPGSNRRDDTFAPERLLPAASLSHVYTTVAALENGISIGARRDGSSPQTFVDSDSGKQWIVANAGGHSEGQITLGEAVYRAIETVFAGVAVEIGPQPIIDAAERLGVSLQGLEDLPEQLGQSAEGFRPLEAVAIGEGSITTFDAAAMFTTISRNGNLTQPVIVESITDHDGRVIYQTPIGGEQTIDPQVVEAIRAPLELVPTPRGTGARADIGEDQVGKTGSNPNYTAAWYAGSTDEYTVAVSVARPGPTGDLQPLTDMTIHDQTYERVFGGSVPAPIWARIMERILDRS